MFTTLQLLHRLSRKTKAGGDISALSGADRLELLDAANAGLGKFAGLLPQTRRESPDSKILRAPLELSLDIINSAAGFTYVGGSPYPAGGYQTEDLMVGHSVAIAGDQRINRLQRPGELLSPYLGTTAERLATFYGDAVQMSQDERRILGRPIHSDTTGDRQLVPLADPARRWWQYPLRCVDQLEVGTPEFFWTEPLLGPERVSTPLWLLRVWPLPSVTATLTYRMESLPAALVMEDFTTARTLPVEDREVPHLVALCAEGLIGSSMLMADIKSTELQNAATNAVNYFDNAEQTRDTRPHRLGTPRRW